MKEIEHEHEYHVAEELDTLIDQDKHVVLGYVICALCGNVKPFTCEESRILPR